MLQLNQSNRLSNSMLRSNDYKRL